jgi:hypothetical protein
MVAGGIMYSEDQWPQRLILASQHSYYTVDGHYETSSSDSDSDEFVELFGPLIDDNSSYQCPGFCVPCSDDQPLWWLVLRWLKMMLLKIARSYHAKPLLLIIAPLMAGLAIGYFLGSTRQRESSQKSRNVSYSKSSPLLTTRIWWSLRDCVALLCFRVGVWMEIGVDADNLVNDDPLDSHHTLSSENNPARSHSSSLITVSGNNSPESLPEKEDHVRANLHSDDGMSRESGVEASAVPHHVAVIMDGNRRYGIAKYGSVSKGHWDGSSKLVEFAKWCIAEQISVLTVYAFSTENWNREPAEVASLMAIFSKYCDELRVEALKRNIRILVLSTDATRVRTEHSETMLGIINARYLYLFTTNDLYLVGTPCIDTSQREGRTFAYDLGDTALHRIDHEYLHELRKSKRNFECGTVHCRRFRSGEDFTPQCR